MSILKCKMCGGDLNFEEGVTVVDCEYCGTKQTVPTIDDEKKITLFARANRLRFACEFDKASGIYESIVADFSEEAEAYWGLVLCKYGIEYVDDPATGKKIPTCHRSSFESVLEDDNFEQVLENADPIARAVYREGAKQIEELRRGIIEVSNKEEPYDIFICYKETAENGERTIDSVIAQDVYDELTAKGYRVFFSRITLEDKLGQEYEPYIFAALNSAKIMLAFGTDYEYYNAVWVKNEWSRFLQLIAKGEKKTLIPCYKNIDAYDMPKEFAKLQAQDMGKVGAMQDLLRGIEKLLPRKESAQPGKETGTVQQTAQSATIDSLLKRVFMYLDDGDWSNATDYCNRVLDISPENAEAYVGLLMAELQVSKEEELASQTKSFGQNKHFMKAIRFTTEEHRSVLEGYRNTVEDYIAEQQRIADEKRKREEEEQRWQEEELCRKLAEKRQSLKRVSCLICAMTFPVIVKSDGTVVTIDKDMSEKMSGWRDIVAVATDGSGDIVGLKSNGTVVAERQYENDYVLPKYNVSDWRDIVAVSAGGHYIVGLKSDGTVVTTDKDMSEKVSDWRDIVAVASYFGIVGLKSNGTVVAAGCRWDMSDWKDIVAVATGSFHIVGLKSDGTVVAVGDNEHGECNVSDWKDIVAVAAGNDHTVGLKSNGTVVAEGKNWDGKCNVSEWRDIIAVSVGYCYTVGLKSDGTVIMTGEVLEHVQKEVKAWKLFNSLAAWEKEFTENTARKQEEDRRRSNNLCQHCGGEFKGLLSKKCSVCSKPKDY